MPSPLGHALAGLIVDQAHSTDADPRGRRALAVLAAVLPDLDLALRYVDGRNHHRGVSHSVGAALLAALLVWSWRRVRGRPRAGIWALVAGEAWLSHIVLDWLGQDTHAPLGLMAFWPVSHAWWLSPWPVFLDIGRTLDWQTFGHNALAAAWEALVLVPLLWLAVRSRRARQEQASGPRV